jgi:hypothetical protein
MGQRRDEERRRILQQIRKMEQAAAESRATWDQCRRQIRRYQHKIHVYEWHLALGQESASSLESMERAVKQLSGLIDWERRPLSTADILERQEAHNIKVLRRELARLDRWERWAARVEDWFWPLIIIRACWPKPFRIHG